MDNDKLRALAEAVKNAPPRILIDDIDKAFIAVASPDRVIALLDEIERLQFHSQQYVKSLNMLKGFSEADPHDAIHELIEENSGLHQQLAARDAEIERLHDEDYRTLQAVLKAEHEACKQLRIDLADANAEIKRLYDAMPAPVFEDGRTLAEVTAETAHERYFIDHETIHDLETGKHVFSNDAARELNSLRQQLAAANAEIAAMTRELERWRHGVTIEGDFVCPDSLELTETKQQLAAMTTQSTLTARGGQDNGP